MVVFANYDASTVENYTDFSGNICVTNADSYTYTASGLAVGPEFSDDDAGKLTFTTPTVIADAAAF